MDRRTLFKSAAALLAATPLAAFAKPMHTGGYVPGPHMTGEGGPEVFIPSKFTKGGPITISFSDDDGETWSPMVDIRNITIKGGRTIKS
jgi:hypothetical protein